MTAEAVAIIDDHLHGLTLKQQIFVREFVSNGGNGTQAARSAGYSDTDDNVLAQQSCQNLRSPKVALAIRDEFALQAKQLFWTRDRFIWELTRVFQRSLAAESFSSALAALKEIGVFEGHLSEAGDPHITISFTSPDAAADDPSAVQSIEHAP